MVMVEVVVTVGVAGVMLQAMLLLTNVGQQVVSRELVAGR